MSAELAATATAAEVVEPLNREDAEKLDRRIRNLAGATKGQLDSLGALVAKARAGRIHEALDYPSWSAYLGDALRELYSDEGIEVRREVVAYLHDAGMPQRAIAAVTGVNQSTVSRDLESAGQVMHDASPGIADEHECPNCEALHPHNPVAAELTVDDSQPDTWDTPAEPEPAGNTKVKVSMGRDGKIYPRQREKPAAKPKPNPNPKGQVLERQPVGRRPVGAENHTEVLEAILMGLKEVFAEAVDAIPGELDGSVTPQIAAELLDHFQDALHVFTPVCLRLKDRRAGTTEAC